MGYNLMLNSYGNILTLSNQGVRIIGSPSSALTPNTTQSGVVYYFNQPYLFPLRMWIEIDKPHDYSDPETYITMWDFDFSDGAYHLVPNQALAQNEEPKITSRGITQNQQTGIYSINLSPTALYESQYVSGHSLDVRFGCYIYVQPYAPTSRDGITPQLIVYNNNAALTRHFTVPDDVTEASTLFMPFYTNPEWGMEDYDYSYALAICEVSHQERTSNDQERCPTERHIRTNFNSTSINYRARPIIANYDPQDEYDQHIPRDEWTGDSHGSWDTFLIVAPTTLYWGDEPTMILSSGTNVLKPSAQSSNLLTANKPSSNKWWLEKPPLPGEGEAIPYRVVVTNNSTGTTSVLDYNSVDIQYVLGSTEELIHVDSDYTIQRVYAVYGITRKTASDWQGTRPNS